MKRPKRYVDMADWGFGAILSTEYEIIPAGTRIYAMPVNEKHAEYDRFAQQYDVHFIFEDAVPAAAFYAVPRIDVFAHDSRGGFFASCEGCPDIASEHPVCYITEDKQIYRAAQNLKALIDMLKDGQDWRARMSPMDGIHLYPAKEDAQRALDFAEADLPGQFNSPT